MHVVRDDLSFFEFCSKGARGERDPWVSIFFRVDEDSIIRICGVELAEFTARNRDKATERVRMRVEVLAEWLKRHKEM